MGEVNLYLFQTHFESDIARSGNRARCGKNDSNCRPVSQAASIRTLAAKQASVSDPKKEVRSFEIC